MSEGEKMNKQIKELFVTGLKRVSVFKPKVMPLNTCLALFERALPMLGVIWFYLSSLKELKRIS